MTVEVQILSQSDFIGLKKLHMSLINNLFLLYSKDAFLTNLFFLFSFLSWVGLNSLM